MGKHQSRTDASQGSPNLEAMQYLQDNWGETEISAAMRVAVTTVSGSDADVTIPVGATIIDAHVVCRKSNGSGSMTVKDGNDNAITNAIACTTDKAVARAGEIDDAYRVVTADGVKIVPNATTDYGDVYIVYKK